MKIKCPFTQRDHYISEAVENDNFCLTKMSNSIKLPLTHQYNYQIQTQIHVTKKNFCNGFVWTKKDYHLGQVYPDENFWSEIVSKCNHFFNMSLIPELVGKFFSKEEHIEIPDDAVSEKSFLLWR